jgi:DNA-binding response OmpR family regulator
LPAGDIWLAGDSQASLDRMVRSPVLLAEAEALTRSYLGRHLSRDGYEVIEAEQPWQALDLAERERPALVLADDYDLCRRLREGAPGRSWDRDVPVIVLASEHADSAERVLALEGGADDVVGRPVVYLELRARIRGLLRRRHPDVPEVLEAGEIVVDRRTRQALVRGVPVFLPGKEFELAAALAAEPNRVFTKAELLRDVWGYPGSARTRTVDSHASRLRRKLRVAPGDGFVVNVWGVGYRLLD